MSNPAAPAMTTRQRFHLTIARLKLRTAQCQLATSILNLGRYALICWALTLVTPPAEEIDGQAPKVVATVPDHALDVDRG